MRVLGMGTELKELGMGSLFADEPYDNQQQTKYVENAVISVLDASASLAISTN